jgi:hypothetical protein
MKPRVTLRQALDDPSLLGASLAGPSWHAWRSLLLAPFSVELWDERDTHVEELIALTGDYAVARAAYEEALKRRPGRIVTLRQKTRVLADSRRKA